jgi:hypothetical protein
MNSVKIFRSALLATSILMGVACATEPASQPSATAAPAPAETATPAPAASATPATPAPAATATPAASAAPAAAAAAKSAEAKPEADAASALEKKFQEAARSYRAVQKDGKTMYCKKEKPINSTIPRMQCMSESQLRLQVEQMEETRGRMRNSSRCTQGAGCGAGG